MMNVSITSVLEDEELVGVIVTPQDPAEEGMYIDLRGGTATKEADGVIRFTFPDERRDAVFRFVE